jgi:HEAT repeat protein
VRDCAVEALGVIRDPRAVDPLVAALRDKKGRDDRRVVVQALGQIGDARATEPLLAALSVGDSVSNEIVQALGQIKDARAIEPLARELRNPYNPRPWRTAAAQTLAQIGDPRAIAPLFAVLQDRDPQVRGAAADALRKLGWTPQDTAQEATYAVATGNFSKVVALGASAVEPLIAALQTNRDNPEWRKHAAGALAQIGDPRAVEPLVTLARDPNCAAVAVEKLEYLLKALAYYGRQAEVGPLQVAAHLTGVTTYEQVFAGYDDGDNKKYTREAVAVDCSEVQQLARAELTRRGLPV